MYFFWFFLSILKFQYCMTISTIFMDNNWFIFDTYIGGLFGVFLFTQLGDKIQRFLLNRFPNKFKRFSRKNRFIVKLRRLVGVTGISFLTPILLGIPLGVMILTTMTNKKSVIYLNMLISLSVWTFTFYLIGLI